MNRIVGKCDRIALHVPTGRKYLVQQVRRDYGTVFCWGEVEAFRGLKTYHGQSIQLPIEEVQIAPCFKDAQLVTELAIQRCRVEGRPYWFTASGRMRVGKPEPARLEQAKAMRAWEAVFGVVREAMANRRGLN